MDKKRTVLIIEDQEINRDILEELLKDEYDVLKASNGEEGLQIVKECSNINAIVLDIVMPVMDGFEFMEAIAQVPDKCNIPIIIATEYAVHENEEKALKMGAFDFVSKPYDPAIVRLRVHNAIDHSRFVALEALHYIKDFDGLTGISNKDSFIRRTRQMLTDSSEEDRFALIRFDITRFAMVNAYYGVSEGDRLLRFIAESIRSTAASYQMTYGRMEADDYVICVKYDETDEIYKVIDCIRNKVSEYELSFNIILIFGVYLINDKSMDIEAMIADANLAAKRIKGNYLNTVAFYDEKLSKQSQNEQEIVNEMKTALEAEQFVVYLQPKYNALKGLPCGAEALVRWKHPEKGMISPGVFIPVFESNGFVEPIDHYMWEHVCILLRDWLDKGMKPNPVSVNVSRVNLYNPRIVEEICELTEKYDIPRELLQLEITESAYTDNTDMILDVINKFHDNGFTILMDDFGSGYSSLNVLKDMSVDVLKIDMKFFSKTENASRAETIIASVVRMAKWLGISTVAEGVETREQVEFLKSVGCVTIQGYYYAKPMPVSEYVELISSGEKFEDEVPAGGPDDFEWANSPEIDELFSSTPYPMCMSEVNGNDVEIVRVNANYYDLFGYEDRIMFVKHPMDRALEDYKEGLLEAYEQVAATHNDQEYKYLRYDSKGEILSLRIELKYIKEYENRALVACYFYKNDDDAIKLAEETAQISRIVDMCKQSDESERGLRSRIAPCKHLPDMVNIVLASRYMDKHALMLVSVDNAEEAADYVDKATCEALWKGMEIVLNQHFRNNDMVARTDDHEYCIFLSSVPSEEIVSIKCQELTRRLKTFANLSKLPLRVAIGVAVSSKDDRNFEKMYETASQALKKGREHGGNRVCMLECGEE